MSSSSTTANQGNFTERAEVSWSFRDHQKLLRRFILVSLWIFPVMAFTMPVDELVKSWQVLDVVKLIVLAFACFAGAFVVLENVRYPRFHQVIDPLVPFFVFFAFALASAMWSPLKSVTIFQSGSLVAMLMYATVVGLLCAHEKETSSILHHLCLTLLAFSAFITVAYLYSPELSGLNRVRIHAGGEGLIHPTASGSTASLGLLIPVLCHFVGKFSWAKRLLLPGLFFHGFVLLISNSRTATGLTVFIVGSVVFWCSSNYRRALFMLCVGLACVAFLLVDPGFKLLDSTLGVGAEYVTRGQSADQLTGVSGREEMWSAILGEYHESMMFGHGYFVTSPTGELIVWNRRGNPTAHNMMLQILVSTGAVGMVLFLYALLQPFLCAISLWKGSLFHRQLLVIIAITCCWYLGWSQLSVSFMGPIRPESVVFFTLLGVAVGQASQIVVKNRLPEAMSAES